MTLDLVGAQEIAHRLGVAVATVHQWRYRSLLPKPDWRLAMGDVWRWESIEEWAKMTGRGSQNSRNSQTTAQVSGHART